MRIKLLCITLLLSIATQAFALSPCEALSDIEHRVSQLRVLPKIGAVGCEELSQDEYIRRTDALNREVNTFPALKLEEEAYKLMGIIPETYPYAECNFSGAGDTSVAFYDYSKKSLVFRKGIKVAYSIIAHEFTHALQDQHFHISRMMTTPLTTDRDLASSAVREGDAMIIEDLYREKFGEEFTVGDELSGSGYRPECEPPKVLFDINIFPYDWGRMLMESMRQKGGYRAINTLFETPPWGTSSLFYPEGSGCITQKTRRSVPLEDSLGEFFLRRILGEVVEKSESIKAAKGLVSDRFVAKKSGQSMHISWDLVFKSESERAQAQHALVQYVSSAMKERVVSEVAYLSLAGAGTGSFSMQCKDRSCRLLRSFP